MANGICTTAIFAIFPLLWSFQLTPAVSEEKILFLLPLSLKSHRILFQPLINSLAEKGYEVTVLTNEPTDEQSLHPSVKEFLPITSEELLEDFPEPFKSRKNGTTSLAFPFQFIIDGCHKVIESKSFEATMRSRKKYDLILVDTFVSNCFDGFLYESGAPFILVTSMPAPSYISESVGNFLPPSFVPVLSYNGYGEPDGHMGFLSRLRNFLHFIMARIYVNMFLLPKLEKVYKSYLGENVPGILEIESSANMVFMNSHFSMNLPRPLLPTVVEIGGMHCRPAKSIKNVDLAKFISKSEAPNGFIYFSVGSIVDMNNAPREFIEILMTTFAKLEQRVVLKWKNGMKTFGNSENPIAIPENMYIGNWFSQQDILGHENTRLFITHGGLLSMQEAVYHGVPILGLPFGVDQHTNVHNAVLQERALKLDVYELTEDNLNASIHHLIHNERYRENARRISKVFRQRPVSPLETAVFWTEYVMTTTKENLTSYIQSPARKLNIFQYYSVDILVFLGMLLLFPVLILVSLVKRNWQVLMKLVSVLRRTMISSKSLKATSIKKKVN